MSNEPKLRILQINIRRSSQSIKQILCQDNWDLILVQEPSKDKDYKTVNNINYYTIYQPNKDSRVATYIRKSVLLAEWTIVLDTKYIQIIELSTNIEPVQIHNIYNKEAKLELEELLISLENKGEHLLIGDFNLYHPRWGGARVLQSERIA